MTAKLAGVIFWEWNWVMKKENYDEKSWKIVKE